MLTNLKINLLARPFGVNSHSLGFSWSAPSRDARNTRKQTGFRIRIFAGKRNAEAGKPFWDSGLRKSDASAGVIFPELRNLFSENSLYYWQVFGEYEDAAGKLHRTKSRPAPFSTGAWESRPPVGVRNPQGGPFAFYRREFRFSREERDRIDKILVTATGLSPEKSRQYVFDLFWNGTSLGVGPSRIGKSPEGQELLFVNTYDATPFLAEENCLSAVFQTEQEKIFACQVTLFRKDGTRQILTETGDGTWRTLDGTESFRPRQSIGTGYYSSFAENVDRSAFPAGFSLYGFPDRLWEKPIPVPDAFVRYRLTPSEQTPVRRIPSFSSEKTASVPSSGPVFDLKKETVGSVSVKISAPAACEIRVFFGEQLNADGSVKYRMNTGNVYAENWNLIPGEQEIRTFGMMTFRYVQFTDLPEGAAVLRVEALQLTTDTAVSPKAACRTDNPLANRLYRMVRHTVFATTQDVFVDSQSRERGAYEGDLLINLFSLWAVSDDSANAAATFRYLLTHRTWPAEYVLVMAPIALQCYLETGDRRILEDSYGVLKNNGFLPFRDPVTGLYTSGNPGGSGTDAILTDWPPSERDGYDTGVTFSAAFNANQAAYLRAMEEISRYLGKNQDADAFREEYLALKKNMLEKLYLPEVGAFSDGLRGEVPSAHCSQHATAYCLFAGIFENREQADRLAGFLEKQGNIRMSVYGAFFLLKGLFDNGYGPLAGKLLLSGDTRPGARTWAYVLDKLHATVSPEAWNETNKPNMTFSHPWGSTPGCALTRGIFGIRPTSPGYRTFEVCVRPSGISAGTLTVPTAAGLITVRFDAKAKTVSVLAPDNTVAKIRAEW